MFEERSELFHTHPKRASAGSGKLFKKSFRQVYSLFIEPGEKLIG
jgi:hypothetical protein